MCPYHVQIRVKRHFMDRTKPSIEWLNLSPTQMKGACIFFNFSVHSFIFAWPIERSIKSLLLQISVLGFANGADIKYNPVCFHFMTAIKFRKVQVMRAKQPTADLKWPRHIEISKFFDLACTHIPDICHGRHGRCLCNFFWQV